MYSTERFKPYTLTKEQEIAQRSAGIYSALDGFWQYLEEMGYPHQAKKAKDACDIFGMVDGVFQLAAKGNHLKLDGEKNEICNQAQS